MRRNFLLGKVIDSIFAIGHLPRKEVDCLAAVSRSCGRSNHCCRPVGGNVCQGVDAQRGGPMCRHLRGNEYGESRRKCEPDLCEIFK